MELNSKPSKPSTKTPGLHLRITKKPSLKDKSRKSEADSSPTASSNGEDSDVKKRPGRSNSATSNSEREDRGKDFVQGDVNQNQTPAEGTAQTKPTALHTDGQRLGKESGQQIIENSSIQSRESSAPKAIDNEPRSRQPVPSSAVKVPPISPPGGGTANQTDLTQKSQSDKDNKDEPKQDQALPPPPLHGILKESKQLNNVQHNGASTQQQNQLVPDHEQHKYDQQQQVHGFSLNDGMKRQQQSGPQGNTRQPVYGENNCDGKAPSRSNSLQNRDRSSYQQPNYSTLPRKSALKKPVADGNPNRYNSLPRRVHNDHEPGGSFSGQQNNVDNCKSWGSLDRKTESDSGFGALDRSFSSTGSSNYSHYPAQHSMPPPTSHRQRKAWNSAPSDASNYAVISSRGRPQAAYPVASQPHHLARPDSVPPLGSKASLNGSGEVFYDAARPGSVPPHHPNNVYGYHSETEAERYGQSAFDRSHRAGSVPLGYESESAAYGYVHPSRRNHFDSDPVRYQRYHYPNTNRSSRGLRVHPDDERYRAGPGKKPIPRRHTVGTAHAAGNSIVNTGDSVSRVCTVYNEQNKTKNKNDLLCLIRKWIFFFCGEGVVKRQDFIILRCHHNGC